MDKPFTSTEAATLDINPVSPGRCYELTPARVGVAFLDHWPMSPGSVRKTSSGRSSILHFAPGRWLIPEPDDRMLEECERYVAAGTAYLIDVEGKWSVITVPAGKARAALAGDCFIESALQGRGCAAMVLFDCPVLIAAGRETFDIWVQSSYLFAFLRVFRSVCEKLVEREE